MSFLTPTVAASVFDATVRVRQIEQVLTYLSKTAFDPQEEDPGVIANLNKCEADLLCSHLLRELAHNYKNVIRRATEKVSVAVRDPLICNLIITPEEISRAISFAAVDQDWESKMHFSRKTKAEIVFTVLDNVVNATIDRTQSVWENDDADEENPGDSDPLSDDL